MNPFQPALVDETANIKDSAKKIVWGAMGWGGQWCTSPGHTPEKNAALKQWFEY